MKTLFCALAVICGSLCAFTAHAAPAAIDYQGFLKNTETGEPLDGQHNLVFRLYGTLSGPDSLWTEAHPGVTLDQGVFSVQLGSIQPFSTPMFQQPALFLEVAVDAQTMSPRTQLVSVPYALFAQVAQHAAQADSAGFAVHAAAADNATHAAYADSAGNSGGGTGEAHWAAAADHIHNTNSGNVGIGTATPAYSLDVHGAIAQRSAITGELTNHSGWVGSAGGFHDIYYDGSLQVHLSGGAANGPSFINSGEVGIGTSTPDGLLSIHGGYRTTGLPGREGIHFASHGASPDMGQLWWGDNTGWKFHMGTRGANGDFIPRFTFLDNGRLGIGTTTPGANVDMEGTFCAAYGANAFAVSNSGSGATLWTNNAYNRSTADAGWTQSLTMMNGKVAIGATSTLGRLRVDDGSFPQVVITNVNDRFDLGISSGNYYLKNQSSTIGQFRFRRGDNHDMMTIDMPTGNVGIGTTNPTATLHVVGDLCVTGQKNAIVPTSRGMTRVYCDESTEVWFTDRGEGKTHNGTAHIDLDPLFLETITVNPDHPLRVHVDVYGTDRVPKIVRGTTGFDVVIAGEDAVEFSWRVEAKRKGYESNRLETLEQTGQTGR